MDYQVFISYRRASGDALAMLLYERLKQDGYTVFLDLKEMKNGRFDRQLKDVIAGCDTFLLLLTQGALERCTDPNDVLRAEIRQAVRASKRIIPLLDRRYRLPETIPDDIAPISLYHGVTIDLEYFEAFIGRIEEMLETASADPKKPDAPKGRTLHAALNELYDRLDRLHCALRRADVEAINNESRILQEDVQEINGIYEQMRFSDKETAARAKDIVDAYNSYADVYMRFISYPPGEARMTPEAQVWAKQTDACFYDLFELTARYREETAQP